MTSENKHVPLSERAMLTALEDARGSGLPRAVEIGSLPSNEPNLGLMMGIRDSQDDLEDIKRRIGQEGLLTATTRPAPLRRFVIRR